MFFVVVGLDVDFNLVLGFFVEIRVFDYIVIVGYVDFSYGDLVVFVDIENCGENIDEDEWGE